MKLRIFTDGACSDNPGPGGWAAIMLLRNGNKILSGNEINTTNNRMELFAVLTALKENINYYYNYDSIEIISDSAYVVNAINLKWIYKWKMNHWKTGEFEEIKNKDLWIQVYDALTLLKDMNVEFTKIKGHSGNAFNEMADKEAVRQRDIAKAKLSE